MVLILVEYQECLLLTTRVEYTLSISRKRNKGMIRCILKFIGQRWKVICTYLHKTANYSQTCDKWNKPVSLFEILCKTTRKIWNKLYFRTTTIFSIILTLLFVKNFDFKSFQFCFSNFFTRITFQNSWNFEVMET